MAAAHLWNDHRREPICPGHGCHGLGHASILCEISREPICHAKPPSLKRNVCNSRFVTISNNL